MKFDQLYSSSSGNLYMVTASNGKRLMIECGVVWPKIQKALDHDLSNIVGCLVSHEHADHSKAVWSVVCAGIDVYASQGTFKALKIGGRRAKVMSPLKGICLDDSFSVYPFEIKHDAIEPFGFVIKADGEYLLYVTDTSHITKRFGVKFSIIAIECSYDKDILRQWVDTKDINEEVAKRLLNSHMEKQTTMSYLDRFCDLSRCREIHLLHMSGDNLDKAQTKMDFEKKLFIETRIVNHENRIQVF